MKSKSEKLTVTQMKGNIFRLLGVKEACTCCGTNKRLVNGILQLQHNIELSCAEDYGDLNRQKERAIKSN